MEREEFLRQIQKVYNNVFRFCMSITKNEDDAKDLCQECFYKALSSYNRKKFKSLSNKALINWLFTIAKNTFINGYRKNKKIKITMEIDPVIFTDTNDQDQTETEIDFKNALNNIDKKYKPYILLRKHGFSYTDICAITGEKIGTVKSKIYYAKKQFAKEIGL